MVHYKLMLHLFIVNNNNPRWKLKQKGCCRYNLCLLASISSSVLGESVASSYLCAPRPECWGAEMIISFSPNIVNMMYNTLYCENCSTDNLTVSMFQELARGAWPGVRSSVRAAAVRGPQPQAGHLPGHHQQAGGTGYIREAFNKTSLKSLRLRKLLD